MAQTIPGRLTYVALVGFLVIVGLILLAVAGFDGRSKEILASLAVGLLLVNGAFALVLARHASCSSTRWQGYALAAGSWLGMIAVAVWFETWIR